MNLAPHQQDFLSRHRTRDPQLFAKSIRLRNQLLNDELSVADGISRTDLNTKFFDAIMEAVAKVSPEVAKDIISSLSELNEKTGNSAGAEKRN